jgi:hypothetical protein
VTTRPEAAVERFILCHADTSGYLPAQMVNAEQLADRISKDLHALHHGQIEFADLPQVYRFVPGVTAHLEQLALQCTNPDEPFDEGWSRREWTVTGPSACWATIRVRVDGRA